MKTKLKKLEKMRNVLIQEPVYSSYCRFIFNCSEQEFLDWVNKRDKTNHQPIVAYGKFVLFENEERRSVYLWLRDKNNIETLAHETLHLVRFWLQDFIGIDLNEKTEEAYTHLLNFYLGSFMRLLGLKKFTSRGCLTKG